MRSFIIRFLPISGLAFPLLALMVVPMAGAGQGHGVAPQADTDIARTFNLLKKQAKENGAIRIIVGLRAPFAPEGDLAASAVTQQHNEIAKMQSAVLGKVPSLKQRPEKIKRFENTPFMALEVNVAELEALAGLAEIVSIQEDRLAAPTSGIGLVKPESK